MKYLLMVSQITIEKYTVHENRFIILIKMTDLFSRIISVRKLITEQIIFVIQEFITQMSILHHYISWEYKKQTNKLSNEGIVILSIPSSSSVFSKIIQTIGTNIQMKVF